MANVGGWDFDPATKQGSWTEEIARIHEVDHTPETTAFLGLEFYQGEHKEKMEAAVSAAITNGTPYDLELELVTAKGTRKWVRTIGSAVIENGRVTRVRGAIQDLTRIREATQALRENEERYRSVFENSLDAVLVTIPDGTILAANQVACRMFGMSEAELCRRGRSGLVDPNDSRLSALLEDRALTGKAQGELTMVKADGTLFLTEISTALYQTSQGTRTSMVIHDITERKRILDELRESRDQLKVLAASLQNAREDERAAVARELHDHLGQILTALKIDVAIVERTVVPFMDPAVKPEFRRQIADISKTIDGGVQDVRCIIRNLRPEILDTFGLVAALEWFGEEFQKRTGVTCTFRADRPTSRIPPEHSTALFRMYQEILTNVTKHANATVVDARLLITPEDIRLTVTDNGRGFDPAKPTSSASLGLLGIRERATGLGGTTNVESQPGMGTTVHVTIPLTATPV
jgi:PAS domain S-box-containing protein